MNTELSIPFPEFLIKSIAEQGYSLETSIADLIDNSISASAQRVEVLINTQSSPFQLFISDDGNGMSYNELKKNMEFPSKSPEDNRDVNDLGRFGLGLKTASFAQTRSFTVITKNKNDKKYNARTWDVNHLKNTGKWEVIINTEEEINLYLESYNFLSNGFLNSFESFIPSTIIVWNGLYKFENNLNNNEQKSLILQTELTETTKEHLQLIFHRFMERVNPLKIRLNNEILTPFNPFPTNARQISTQQKLLIGDKLKLEGFVLPNTSIQESKGISEWTLTHKSLMDMEGMYIYRADRIIVFGGWNGLIKKSSRLQLARLKVEIGNGIDHLFHLNVAKSSIIIPFGERIGFIRYVSELKREAEKESFNYTEKGAAPKSNFKSVFKKVPTTKGISLVVDKDFPLISALLGSLNKEQCGQLKMVLKMITTSVNKIKQVHSDETFTSVIEKEVIEEKDILNAIKVLLNNGINKSDILNEILPAMGIDKLSLPESILTTLK